MPDAPFSSLLAQIVEAVPEAEAAYRARLHAAQRADETAAARLAAAETSHANQTAWAAEQLSAVGAAANDGASRAPKEIDAASYVPPPPRSLLPDARLGLQTAARNAQGGLSGMQEGGRQLLLWLARRSSILGGIGIGALVLLGALGLFIFGRITDARQAEATATAAVIAAITAEQQTAEATRTTATAVSLAATRAEATANAPTPRPSATATATRTPRPADAEDEPAGEPSDEPAGEPTQTETAGRGPETLVIGHTSIGTPVEAVRFGDGPRTILFVGGMHAGFAPGTVALAQQAVAYFSDNLDEVPDGATLYVVISASPDTPHAPGELAGRLNSNGVDANRNWGCRWTTNARFRNEVVPGSGGAAEFSEPEVISLRDFILDHDAAAVVFWEAQAGWSSPGSCGSSPIVSTLLAEIYGAAAGYRVVDFEETTDQELNGDSTNWLDSQGIPAISILLPSYEGADWENNLRGMLAVLEAYGR